MSGKSALVNENSGMDQGQDIKERMISTGEHIRDIPYSLQFLRLTEYPLKTDPFAQGEPVTQALPADRFVPETGC